MLRDLRLAARALMDRPIFLLSAVLTLALGLGAAVTTFGVVDRLLLRPLSYHGPERLIFVTGVLPGDAGPGASLSFLEFHDIRARARTIASIAGYADSRPIEVAADSGPRAARVNFVNTAYFDILGARAAAGRLLDGNDERAPGAHQVAVVSDAFWRAHLGGRADVLGSTMRIGDLPYTVVGVMTPSFRDLSFEIDGQATDIWLSSMMSLPAYGPTFLNSRASRVSWAVARLADGVTLEQARAELSSIAADLERQFPDTNRRIGLHAERLDLWLFRDARTPFFVVFTGAFVLLAVAALNVTGLLVVRMAERSRDLVVRRSLGATTSQLVRPALAEGVVIAGLAAIVGSGVAAGLLAAVRTSAPYVFPRLQTLSLDARALIVLVALSSVAVAAMAAASLLLVRWRGHSWASAARSVVADRLTVRLQRVLVAGEVGFAVVLLAASVLVVRGLGALESAPLGFNPDRLTTTRMELRADRYRDDARVIAFGQALLAEARAVPGVEQAFLWGPGRPGRDTWISYPLTEVAVTQPDPDRVMVWRHNISAGALAQAGIPLVRGREFTAADRSASPFVAIVSQSMAQRFWPGEDAIGKRFTFVTPVTPRPWFQIVGIAADAANRQRIYSGRLPEYDYYQFFDQRPERTLTLITRSAPASDASDGLRRAVARADSALPIREMRTMADLLDEEEQAFRFAAALLSGFSALTFLLSAAGLYALIGYVIALRTRELALRSALGATRARLFQSLLWTGLKLGLAGIVAGVVLARGGASWLGSLLYGVDPAALDSYIVTAAIMAAIVVAATSIPAARVRGIDPSRALRD
ncbi:MAG TPA: ABC transporter permease [Vicinamibacterales bacterium]|nr:ABC transporter permease [Vicinamibacterales bacterium]